MASDRPPRALVLAGGRGRRLAPFTTIFPKPLAPIGDVPIIEIVLRQLRWHGISEVVVSVGYLGELIQAYFATRGGMPGLEITYLRETSPLGTAGAVGLLEEVDGDLLVVNGDVLTTFDFSAMIDFHRRERPALTIAVHPHTVTVDLGVLEIDAQSVVRGFTEKPSLSFECSMGINVYSPLAVREIEPGQALDFPTLAQRLIDRGERVLAYRSECYWQDIGRRDDYERALDEFPEMRARLLPGEPADPSSV
jgi:NDP-sugar pyrophosphorylase family protein